MSNPKTPQANEITTIAQGNQDYLFPPILAHEQQGYPSVFSEDAVPPVLHSFFKKNPNALNRELTRRYPTMPLLSAIHFHQEEQGLISITSQDGTASLFIDVNDQHLQFTFTFRSMMSLKFNLRELSELDRTAWMENLLHRKDQPVFLWGASRWEKDYLIFVPQHYYTNLFAFSAMNFEAGVRIIPKVSEELVEYLKRVWEEPSLPVDDEQHLSSLLGKW
ncbi:MAG: hypothetical protein ACOYLB_00055 [Phototrophicaceae bacterium]